MYGFDMSRIKAMALLEPLVDNVDPEQVLQRLEPYSQTYTYLWSTTWAPNKDCHMT